MARLPQAADLQRLPMPAATPGVRVGAVDYGPLSQGDQQIARGLQGIAEAGGRAIDLTVKADHEIDDYETRKRLLDFKLQTEMELEQHKRDMPQGGAGYAESWAQKYRDRAAEFVGEKDANIPARLRNQVGLMLKHHETVLSERAQRDEWAERDRTEIEGLEQTLGMTRSAVEADPRRRDEMRAEGERLIDTSRISPAAKDRLIKQYRKELDKTAIIARGLQIGSAEDRESLRLDLGPDLPDRRSAVLQQGGKAGPAAGWAARNPEWQRLDGYQKAAVMALMEADGAAAEDARNALGAMINRAAKSGEDLGAHVSQKIYQPTIEPAQEARIGQLMRTKAFGELTEWARRRAAGQEADPVNGATHFLAPEQTMLALEAKEPQKYRSWRQWTGFDGKSYRGVVTRDGSHAFLAPEGAAETAPAADGNGYAGPYSTLTLQERKALWGQVETEWRKKVGAVEKVIKDQMAVAGDGLPPPQPVLDALAREVRAVGDPMLTAQYQIMLQRAEATRNLMKAPPMAAESLAREQRAYLDQHGATREMDEAVKHTEKVAAAIRKNVNDNPMGWAQKTGIEVPLAVEPPPGLDPGQRAHWKAPTAKITLETINFAAPDIDAVLSRRMQQAKGLGFYYGQPPQVFTPNERDHLKDVLKLGGNGMLFVVGAVAKAAAASGIEPAQVMREFTKDAPELEVVGGLVANGGDGRLLDTAAKAMAWRTQMGDKFDSTIDKALVKPDLGEFAQVLATTPTKPDHVKALANIVYEYEARQKGHKEFNPATYKSVVKRIMGETMGSDGVAYGGVGDQGTGWGDGKLSSSSWFGKTPKVLVPAGVRQDSFDQLVGALRASDLLDAGGLPLDRDRNPLGMAEIRRAIWVSFGPGQYALQLGEDRDGRPLYAAAESGKPYAIDLRPVLDRLRQRQPSIFAGYNPQTDEPKVEPDTEYPSWWTGAKPVAPAVPPQPAPGDGRARRQMQNRAMSGVEDQR